MSNINISKEFNLTTVKRPIARTVIRGANTNTITDTTTNANTSHNPPQNNLPTSSFIKLINIADTPEERVSPPINVINNDLFLTYI